jgi:GAF domain-containing protein
VSGNTQHPRANTAAALGSLARSVAANIPGAEFTSITVRRSDGILETVASTDPLADKLDETQYTFQEGPCYAAVTDERFILVNDLRASSPFPRYTPVAVQLGVAAQLAVQLVHNGEQAGLNVYALTPAAFDRSTVDMAELFAAHAGLLLGYARQAGTIGEAVHTRQDIGTAVGVVMERYAPALAGGGAAPRRFPSETAGRLAHDPWRRVT